MACSATDRLLDPGAFATTMPFWVAALTSMLSTPTPARPIILGRVAFSRTSAVILLAERTRIAS